MSSSTNQILMILLVFVLRVIMNTQAALGGCRTPGDVMVKVLSKSIMQ